LRTLLLQVLYTVRSERMLMEQLAYNFLFRWFVGLSIDDPVWDPTVFSKNRDRLLTGEVAGGFFTAVVEQARAHGLLTRGIKLRISLMRARDPRRGPRSARSRDFDRPPL